MMHEDDEQEDDDCTIMAPEPKTLEAKIEAVHDVADEIGGKVRTDYSGRGMYGKTCYGITCDNEDECIEAAGAKGLRGARTDNMGRGTIVYWPSIKGKDS